MGSDVTDVVTASQITVARHQLAADGLGVMVRDHGHVYALDQAAMAGANTGRPHRRKERIPPGTDALATAAALRAQHAEHTESADDQSHSSTTQSTIPEPTAIVYDLSVYERAAHGRNTLS